MADDESVIRPQDAHDTSREDTLFPTALYMVSLPGRHAHIGLKNGSDASTTGY
jgi:hypothetical protein